MIFKEKRLDYIGSEIFQRALTVKRILKEKIFSLSSIKGLLNEVEKYGEKYSFYWIQRGIAAQKDNEFDLADHYFRKISGNPRQFNFRDESAGL